MEILAEILTFLFKVFLWVGAYFALTFTLGNIFFFTSLIEKENGKLKIKRTSLNQRFIRLLRSVDSDNSLRYYDTCSYWKVSMFCWLGLILWVLIAVVVFIILLSIAQYVICFVSVMWFMGFRLYNFFKSNQISPFLFRPYKVDLYNRLDMGRVGSEVHYVDNGRKYSFAPWEVFVLAAFVTIFATLVLTNPGALISGFLSIAMYAAIMFVGLLVCYGLFLTARFVGKKWDKYALQQIKRVFRSWKDEYCISTEEVE